MPAANRATRRRNSARTKERILRAGIALFAKHGPSATTIRMLAGRAGVNRRMLYYYFGSKEGLYRAAMRSMYEQNAIVETELSRPGLSAEELLDRFVRALYAFLSAHPEFVRLLTWENLRQGRTVRHVDIGAVMEPVVEALRVALDRGKSEGRFRRDIDEKQLLISCMSLSFFTFANRHTVSRAVGVDLASSDAVERRVKHVVRLLLDGIRVHEDGRRPRRSRS